MLQGPLFHDLTNRAGADGAAAFANGEAQAFLHRYRRDQLDVHFHVVARHHHLHSRRQMRHSRHIRRSEVELRPVAREERRVPPAFFLRQHIGLCLELRVRRDAPRPRDYLPPLDVLALYSPEQQPHVVACCPFVQQLLEHLHPRHYRLERRPDAHYFHRLVDLHLAPLYSARGHRPPSLDRKDVFDRHQERLLDIPRRSRNVAVHGFHQLQDLLLGLLIPVQRLQRRHL